MNISKWWSGQWTSANDDVVYDHQHMMIWSMNTSKWKYGQWTPANDNMVNEHQQMMIWSMKPANDDLGNAHQQMMICAMNISKWWSGQWTSANDDVIHDHHSNSDGSKRKLIAQNAIVLVLNLSLFPSEKNIWFFSDEERESYDKLTLGWSLYIRTADDSNMSAICQQYVIASDLFFTTATYTKVVGCRS